MATDHVHNETNHRPIKFRAWDGTKMHYDVSPWRWDFVILKTWHRCEKSTGPGFLGTGGGYAEMLVPAVRFKNIMQYSGVSIRKGDGYEDLYEGDVVYLAGYGNYVLEFPFIQLYESLHEGDVCNKLGNIYENPELLEK